MNEINNPEILRDVTQAFEQYESALTGNDIATLDALFWASDNIVRLGATENLYDHDRTLAFRKAHASKGLDG